MTDCILHQPTFVPFFGSPFPTYPTWAVKEYGGITLPTIITTFPSGVTLRIHLYGEPEVDSEMFVIITAERSAFAAVEVAAGYYPVTDDPIMTALRVAEPVIMLLLLGMEPEDLLSLDREMSSTADG